MAQIDVIAGANLVVARSPFRLGFCRPEQREFRDRLQRACRRLVAGDGEVLRATYGHPLVAGDAVDVENVTTYNLGTSCLQQAARYGVVIERDHDPTADPRFPSDSAHVLTYEVDDGTTWRHWRAGEPLASLTIDGCDALPRCSAPRVWAAARRGDASVHRTSREVPEAITVDVTIASAPGRPVTLLGVMKPLVDGLLAALHRYTGPHLDLLVERLGVVLPNTSGTEVRRWLGSDDEQPLGGAAFLLPRGAGVQVSPADDRIVALRLTATPGEPGVHCLVSEAAPLTSVNSKVQQADLSGPAT